MFNGCCQNNRNMNNGCIQRECPVVEPTITNCVEKNYYHEVPQDCPFMINNK